MIMQFINQNKLLQLFGLQGMIYVQEILHGTCPNLAPQSPLEEDY